MKQIQPQQAPTTGGYADDLSQMLRDWLGRRETTRFDDGCTLPFLPPHHLQVWTRPTLNSGELLITNGFGRVGQPQSGAGATHRFIELAAVADAPIPDVATTLLVLARTLHVRATLGLPIQSWRVASLPAPVGGLRNFLLVPLVRKELRSGRTITVMQVIPLVAGDKIPWIRRHPHRWLDAQNAHALSLRWKKRPLNQLLSPPAL
jgi:hypothetical protein